MKKFLMVVCALLSMVLILCLAGCGSHVDIDGNVVEVEVGDVVVDIVDGFTITKIDKSDYYIRGIGRNTDYTVTLKGAEYALLIHVDASQYTCWEIEDIIEGKLVSTYVYGESKPLTTLTVGEDMFDVEWYGVY